MNRRVFVKSILAQSIFLASGCARAHNHKKNSSHSINQFVKWTKTCQPNSGFGLVSYFSSSSKSKNPPLSTIASANLLLFFLKIGDIRSAEIVANGFVHWQHQIIKQGNKYIKGGLPTEFINKSSDWKHGQYFYASDNMIVANGLYEIYKITGKDKYATAALKLSKWLEQRLFDGLASNMWFRNYGPPMNYIRNDGAVDNTIHTAGNFLWLTALNKIHLLDRSAGWDMRLKDAIKFLHASQMDSGAWYSYFKPSKRKSKNGTWHSYRDTNLVLGDDNLRSALAAHEFGMTSHVKKFKEWLFPHEDVFLWGYLHTDKSNPKFLANDSPYFDVVCTGLLRAWYKKNNQPALAHKCQEALNELQNTNGSWNWGVLQKNLKPLNDEHAMVTGCWSLVDLV